MMMKEKEYHMMKEMTVRAIKTTTTHKGTKITKNNTRSRNGLTMWVNSQVCA